MVSFTDALKHISTVVTNLLILVKQIKNMFNLHSLLIQEGVTASLKLRDTELSKLLLPANLTQGTLCEAIQDLELIVFNITK